MKLLAIVLVLPALCLGQWQQNPRQNPRQNPGMGPGMGPGTGFGQGQGQGQGFVPGQGGQGGQGFVPGQGGQGFGPGQGQGQGFRPGQGQGQGFGPGQGQGQIGGAKCKGGWFLIGQQCFKMMSRALKWNDAELMCEQNAPCGTPVLGGVMTIPDNYTSASVVNHLRSLSSTGRAIDIPFWTGLHNKWNQLLERYEGWKWPSGWSTTQQPLPFVNWAPMEPNNQLLDQQHSYCAAMNRMGQWYVVRCDEPMYFMCSMPVSPPLQAGTNRNPGMGMLVETPAQIVNGYIELPSGLLMREGVGGN